MTYLLYSGQIRVLDLPRSRRHLPRVIHGSTYIYYNSTSVLKVRGSWRYARRRLFGGGRIENPGNTDRRSVGRSVGTHSTYISR